MKKLLKFGCAPILLMGVLLMGPTAEVLSKRDASDYGSMKPATVSADKVDASQEGKLVFVSGPFTAAPIHDPELDFTIPAMRLRRQVAIWQWRQYEHDITHVNPNTGKSEHVRYEYSYSQEWSDRPLDSSKYIEKGHDNPPARLPDLFNLLPTEVKVGAYRVPTELLDRLGGYFPWHSPSGKPARAGTWDAAKGEFFPNLPADGKPVVGTIRYTYAVTDLPKEASAMGQLKGDTLSEFTTAHGLKKPELQTGSATAQEFLKADVANTGVVRWFFRICNFIALLGAGFFFGLRGPRLVGFVAVLLLFCHGLPALFLH